MKNELEYKGYIGSIEVDLEAGAIVGKLLFLQDVIAYSSKNVSGIEAAFRQAVDEYLAFCEQVGDEPDRPCKGTFNVRVGPDLHRQAALSARREGRTLNEFVASAVEARCRPADETHIHIHRDVEPPLVRNTSSTHPQWEPVGGRQLN